MAQFPGSPQTWRITSEDRAKHDNMFFPLRPVGGYISGDQAKGFFLQSGLPPDVLGKIWTLADMNSDGRMDKKEFSIAMFLIKKKLEGNELPSTLPAGLKSDPVPGMGSFGTQPIAGFSSGMPMNSSLMMSSFQQPNYYKQPWTASRGSVMPMSVPSMGQAGFATMPSSSSSAMQPMSTMGGMSTLPAKSTFGPGVDTQMSRSGSASPPTVSSSGEWAVPQQSKLKYNQLFNTHDRMRSGWLSGVQARGVLVQSGLPQPALAQIWTLSDIDKDGKLTREEFVLAMHLVDMVKSGKPLPQTLPPDFIPPSFRRKISVGGGVGPGAAVGMPPTSTSGGLGTMGGLGAMGAMGGLGAMGGMGGVQPLVPMSGTLTKQGSVDSVESTGKEEEIKIRPMSLEEKKKQNFDRGQQELERRRALLLQEQQRERERHEAKERAEMERKERIRLEQERRKQMEMEKMLARQREIEAEKEEQRRKIMEQREAAKRELERQKQIEWERNKRQELTNIRIKEQEVVCHLKARNKTLDYEIDGLESRKGELNKQLIDSKLGITEKTTNLTLMAQTRGIQMTEIERLEQQLQEFKQKEFTLEQEKDKCLSQLKRLGENNPTGDTLRTVMFSFNNKQTTMKRLAADMADIEKTTALKLQDIDQCHTQLNDLKSKLPREEMEVQRLKSHIQQKQNEIVATKREIEETNRRKNFEMEQQKIKSEEERRKREDEERKRREQQIEAIRLAQLEADRKKIEDEKRRQEEEKQRLEEERRRQEEDLKRQAEIKRKLTESSKKAQADHGEELRAKLQQQLLKQQQFDVQQVKETPKTDQPQPQPQPQQDMDFFANFDDAFQAQPTQPPQSNLASAVQEDHPITGIKTQHSHEAVSEIKPGTAKVEISRYRALYAFEAQNEDELSLNPGDIVQVAKNQNSEPGWLGGEVNGRTGWFPENYVEKLPSEPSSPVPTEVAKTETIPEEKNAWNQLSSSVTTDSGFETTTQVTQDTTTTTTESAAESTTTTESLGWSAFTQVTPHTNAFSSSPTPEQGQSVPDGVQAQAIYPWRAKKDNHLTFNKNDIINIREQQDMWWRGELSGQEGWFPKSYVKLISAPRKDGAGTPVSLQEKEATPAAAANVPISTTPTPDVATNNASPALPRKMNQPEGEACIGMYAYSSTEPGDLVFSVDEIIIVTKKDGDWWTGHIGDRSGMFPQNYVRKLTADEEENYKQKQQQSSQQQQQQPQQQQDSRPQLPELHITESTATKGSAPSAPSSLERAKKPEIAQVIVAYTATGEEQLSLQPGQLIQVKKKNASGWWEGELQARGKKRQIGWFPANFVKLLGSATTPSSTPTPEQQKSSSPFTVPAEVNGGAPPVNALCQVIAMYPYTAQNDDEITFSKGSVINVVSKEDKDWWKGELNGTTGLFPQNYVKQLTDAEATASNKWYKDQTVYENLKPIERKRQQHIHEMIDTEQSYVENMILVVEAFYKPMSESSIVSKEELSTFFVNWKEIIMCNMKLSKAMKVRKKMSGESQVIRNIGDILCEQLPHMTPYIRFCSCQLRASTLLQKKTDNGNEFKNLMKKLSSNPKTKGMPLSSFLIKPMQRITKYPLLISKILENTPVYHPDHDNVSSALEKAEELCTQVNEGVREKENSDRLEWLQSHVQCDGLAEELIFNSLTNCLGQRKYLYSGALVKAKSNKELFGFLFNDFLLLTTPTKQGINLFDIDAKPGILFKMYRNPLFLNEISVKIPNDKNEEIAFNLSHIDKVYTLKTESVGERTKWLNKIEEATKEFVETEKRKREKAHQARAQRNKGVGRLLVVIIEGADLKPVDKNGLADPYCEVSMGVQEHKTKIIPNTLNPKWNSSMQFTVRDIDQDVLCVTVFDRDLFSPNDFLGRTEIRVSDIKRELQEQKVRGPLMKKVLLYETVTGEVSMKLDLQLFDATS